MKLDEEYLNTRMAKYNETFWMNMFGYITGIEWLIMRVLIYMALIKFIFLFF